jgi:hypothetical protein
MVFNANSAIFQLYHGEFKMYVSEMNLIKRHVWSLNLLYMDVVWNMNFVPERMLFNPF